MSKHKKGKRTSSKAVAAVPRPDAPFEGTPEEHVEYLQNKIRSLQALVDEKNRCLQRVRKRDIEMDKLSDIHNQQLDELEQEHEKAFERMEERHERELEKLTLRHDKEIEEMEARHDREMERLENKYNVSLSDGEDEDEVREEEDEQDE